MRGDMNLYDLDKVMWGDMNLYDLDKAMWGDTNLYDLDKAMWGDMNLYDLDRATWGDMNLYDLDKATNMYDVWWDMNFELFSLPYWYLFCFHLQASSRLEDPSAHLTKGFLRYHGDYE